MNLTNAKKTALNGEILYSGEYELFFDEVEDKFKYKHEANWYNKDSMAGLPIDGWKIFVETASEIEFLDWIYAHIDNLIGKNDGYFLQSMDQLHDEFKEDTGKLIPEDYRAEKG